jgi:hypothetical protein
VYKNKVNKSKLHSLIRQNSLDPSNDGSASKIIDPSVSHLKSGRDLTAIDSVKQEESQKADTFLSSKTRPKKIFATNDLLKIGSTWMTELNNQIHNYKSMVEYKRDEQNRREDYAVEVVLKKHQDAHVVASCQQLPPKLEHPHGYAYYTNIANPVGQISDSLSRHQARQDRLLKRDDECVGSLAREIKDDILPMISDLQKIAQSDHLSAFKADRRKKIARLLAEKVKKLLKMNITIEEFMEKAPFPHHPFSRPETKRLFALVRANDAEAVKKILERCKYYVYEYDQVAPS